MTGATVLLAILRFACWEAALFAMSIVLARALGWRGARRIQENILAVLAIEIVLESSFAGLFSFTGTNRPLAYWMAATLCALVIVVQAIRLHHSEIHSPPPLAPRTAALFAALLTPLIFLSFRPVEEIDSLNYLHYLIEWMANRATPYCFATNYVAFWELSFLPAWTITGLDLFFPLLALKAVILLALAAWLVGRELGLRRHVLLWTVFGIVLLRPLWWESSGVRTLKNDVLHGVGFVLLTVVVLRAARRSLHRIDAGLFALAAAFAAVKYTGIFLVAIAAAAILFFELRRPQPRRPLAVASLSVGCFVLLTSGHYYLHNLLLYGSPFYPFQINLAFLHLPGTADLSGTSILFNLRNRALWRALFLPAGGLSRAGLLFPVTLAATLVVSLWKVARTLLGRRPPTRPQVAWTAALLLAGWFLYFRSVYSAGTAPGNLDFILGLNTVRYVIGVLAVSELFLIALLSRLPRLAISLVVLNAASRAAILYALLPLNGFQVAPVIAVTAVVYLSARVVLRYTPLLPAALSAVLVITIAGPFLVEHNRANWLSWWSDLKPALAAVRGPSLALLTYEDLGYFAGHVLAAGNPVHPAVRSLSPHDLDVLPASQRPRYLAALSMPSDALVARQRFHQTPAFLRWGYAIAVDSPLGILLENTLPPIAAPAALDAWYAPPGSTPIAGMPVLAGHILRTGDIVADASGALVRLDPQGRQPLQPAEGTAIRLLNCGDLDFAPAFPQGRPSGAVYRWESDRWESAPVASSAESPLPSPSWVTSISDGRYVQQLLSEGPSPFLRLSAQNDARWLIYSAAYPKGLPDGIPVTVRALVRCPTGCSVSTAGHAPELDQPVRSPAWTPVNLSFAFQRNGRPQHVAVGLASCHRGDWFDLRRFDLRIGTFPFD